LSCQLHKRQPLRSFLLSPTLNVTFSVSKYSINGMTNLRETPVISLNWGVVISPLDFRKKNYLHKGDSLATGRVLDYAVETEQTLLEEQSVWTARSATLADPTRLSELAEERGFERPARVIELHPVRMAASARP